MYLQDISKIYFMCLSLTRIGRVEDKMQLGTMIREITYLSLIVSCHNILNYIIYLLFLRLKEEIQT